MRVLTEPITRELTGSKVIYFSVSQDDKWESERAIQLMGQLHNAGATMGIIGTSAGIDWYVLARDSQVNTVVNILESLYPGVQLRKEEEVTYFPHYVYDVHIQNPFIYPIKFGDAFKKIDPLVNIAAVCSHLREGERFAYIISTKLVSQEMLDIGAEIGQKHAEEYEHDPLLKEVMKKFDTRPMLVADIEVKIGAPTKKRADELANMFYRALDAYDWKISNYFCQPTATSYTPVLNLSELAGLWHPPNQHFKHLKVSWAGLNVSAPTEFKNSQEGLLLGDNSHQGSEVPIYLPDIDRTTHMNIIGKTGVGKSTFMHNMIHQDIAAGRGVAVIDPHGELVRDVLRGSIPQERVNDVVLLDIADLENPPPINPLTLPENPLERAAATSQVLAILDKVDSNSMTDRIADTLSNVLSTLANDSKPNVRDVGRLFSDIAYRNKLLRTNNDPVVEDYWYDFEAQSERIKRDLAYPVLHRMRKFYRNPILYNIMCHPRPLDFSRLVEQKKIILISLGIDEALLPQRDRQFLGAVLLAQLEMAQHKAAKRQEDNTLEYYLYIDEVQNFTNAANSLEKILSEARKYGLRLTMANQYLGQLKGDVLEAVMGNIGATAAFQVGLTDARILAPYFAPNFDIEALATLDRFTMAAKIRHSNNNMPAFTIATRPHPVDTSTDNAKERERIIRGRSKDNYLPLTTPQIQAWLKERYARKDRPDGQGDSSANSEDTPGNSDVWRTKDEPRDGAQ